MLVWHLPLIWKKERVKCLSPFSWIHMSQMCNRYRYDVQKMMNWHLLHVYHIIWQKSKQLSDEMSKGWKISPFNTSPSSLLHTRFRCFSEGFRQWSDINSISESSLGSLNIEKIIIISYEYKAKTIVRLLWFHVKNIIKIVGLVCTEANEGLILFGLNWLEST